MADHVARLTALQNAVARLLAQNTALKAQVAALAPDTPANIGPAIDILIANIAAVAP